MMFRSSWIQVLLIGFFFACLSSGGRAGRACADDKGGHPGETASAIRTVWPRADAPSKRIRKRGVPNFGELNPFVWRSGQPTPEGIQELKRMGVRTIVNLREVRNGKGNLVLPGVRVVSIPLTDQRPPTREQAIQFLNLVGKRDNWPILFHCREGEGRTGVMSALIRYSFDGWEHEKIMQEIRNFQVPRFGFYKTKMFFAQRHFIEQWEKTNVRGGYLAATTSAVQQE